MYTICRLSDNILTTWNCHDEKSEYVGEYSNGRLEEDILTIQNENYVRFFHDKCIKYNKNSNSCKHSICRNQTKSIGNSDPMNITSYIPYGRKRDMFIKSTLVSLNEPYYNITDKFYNHSYLFVNEKINILQLANMDLYRYLYVTVKLECTYCNENITYDFWPDVDKYGHDEYEDFYDDWDRENQDDLDEDQT